MRVLLCVWVVIASLISWPSQAADEVFVPNYREQTVRSESPDLLGRRVLRFVTSDDFPPFQSLGPDGALYGLNVDLARALCGVLELSCTIQAVPWNRMQAELQSGRADAIIAGLRPSETVRETLDFTNRYLQLPARFVARKDSALTDIRPETLKDVTIAVITGTAHEAYLRAFFALADIRPVSTAEEARAALAKSEADLLFGDGITMAAWLATGEGGCCEFRGGPYLESRFFGEGFAIAVRRGDNRLRQALDHALDVTASNGTFGNIYLRYFPIGIY